MTIQPELLDAYRFHRQERPRSAAMALQWARDDVAKGKRRYPSSSIGSVVSRQSSPNYGPNYAWIEDTAAIGLRFVGHADELIRSIDHKGWFMDDDFQDEVLRGGVWQFPARNGCPIYVAGYSDPNNKGAAFLCLDLIEGNRGEQARDFYSQSGARDAAFQADSIAERAAERERQYRAESNARARYEDLGETIASTRSDLLAVLGERRIAKARDPEGFPALCKLIRHSVQRGLDRIETARKQRGELVDRFGGRPGWLDF